MELENRIVALIDMDCFYCQVEEKLDPELKGKPLAVVQYNPWKGGGVLAVNYIARARGVGRYIRGDEARQQCPEIQLRAVPSVRGKADMTRYREAGKEVAKVLQRYTSLFERASIDEAYLDITAPVQQRLKTLNVNTITKDTLPNTFALGYENIEEFIQDVRNCCSDNLDFEYEHTKQLLVGAIIVSEIRAAVFNETGYECSGGIAHNKIMAKLVCGMNKPNKQTILPKHCVDTLFESLPIKKVKHMGRKFGDSVCKTLNVSKMIELQKFTKQELHSKFDEKNGSWLYNIARGIDLEPVQVRLYPKSVGCCKQFRGKLALIDLESVRMWLSNLSDEVEERLEQDSLECNRAPRQMVVSFSQQINDRDVSSSRSYNFAPEDELSGELFTKKALELLLDSTEGVKPEDREPTKRLRAPIKLLGLSVGKFEELSENKKTKKIKDYFTSASTSKQEPSSNNKMKSEHSIKDNNINKSGKELVLQKFFQNNNLTNLVTEESNQTEAKSHKVENISESLDKQESFFTKFLKIENNKNSSDKNVTSCNTQQTHLFMPDCNNDNCEEASNDTDYSGSTIEKEINKSISLFEDDPYEVDRVSNMRQLLKKSEPIEDFDLIKAPKPRIMCKEKVQHNLQPEAVESIKCPECGKTVDVNALDIHADYHLALKLREEERELKRKEILDKNVQRGNNQCQEKKMRLNEVISKVEVHSIKNYFVKIDENLPTEKCSECGKRIPLDRFTEHLDFHEAQRISREINQKPVQTNLSDNFAKRKRKSGSPVKKPKVPCQSLDLFFR